MQIVNEATGQLKSQTEYLSTLSSYVFEKGMSMALWRLPNEPKHHLIISENPQMVSQDKQLEDLPSGFIFAPFDSSRDRIFLEGDFHFVFNGNKLDSHQSQKEETSLNELLAHTPESKSSPRKSSQPAKTFQQKSKADYISIIQDAVLSIEQNHFEKVVPSRLKKMPLPEHFDVVQAFEKLCVAYPNTLVSFVHIPGVGSWLGASPETLVEVENGVVFKTVALAGTKAYDPDVNLKSVTWTQKEIEEQALVERYIISCFKKIRLREFDEHGPKTVVAGNLLHLKSDFMVDMKATNFPQLGSVMLGLLHPTSAVCGMPLDKAKEFLQKYENYDREFYAGYLGPVNINNNTNIFVNLRCLQLLEGEAILYAGAGVTADSIPENEWEETEIKFNTLSTVLF
jgi:isochorismate synthase